jgi:glucose/arabinose dehydrogenase
MLKLRPVAYTLLACFAATSALARDDHQAGQAIYQQHCASCHGDDLTGGNAQSMIDGVWQYGAGRGNLIRNTKFGISAFGMPAYKDALSDKQIKEVVDYILHKQDQAAPQPPPLPETLQTRDYDVAVKVVAEGLDIPWAMTFIDQDTAFITERSGQLRLFKDDKLDPKAIKGTPEVFAVGQGGLLDVAIDPDYADNGWVYLAYSHTFEKGDGNRRASMTRVVRGKIQDHQWTDQQVVYEAPRETYLSSGFHYGSRIAFDSDGYLYFTIGDRGRQDDAQDVSKPQGKVHRIQRDGTIPADNPFTKTQDALPSIYALGNRNPQGLAIHPKTGKLWSTEHGPMGGDELNLIEPGVNYGWPIITYGLNYNGSPVSQIQKKDGLAQPILYWTPSIAVCGIDFVRGDHFPRWENDLFVTGLGYEELRRLNIANGRVLYQETILKNHGRVRDVASAPDGTIYVVLNNPGTILKLTNAGEALRQ